MKKKIVVVKNFEIGVVGIVEFVVIGGGEIFFGLGNVGLVFLGRSVLIGFAGVWRARIYGFRIDRSRLCSCEISFRVFGGIGVVGIGLKIFFLFFTSFNVVKIRRTRISCIGGKGVKVVGECFKGVGLRVCLGLVGGIFDGFQERCFVGGFSVGVVYVGRVGFGFEYGLGSLFRSSSCRGVLGL